MSNTHQLNQQLVRPQDAPAVTIREAVPDDLAALERLAQLDSTRLPIDDPQFRSRNSGIFLVAEVADEVRAAYSLSEQRAIADPFHRTAELVELLRLHARQRDGNRGRRRRASRSTAPQPPGLGIGLLPTRLGGRAA
jgi:hypothetical protein